LTYLEPELDEDGMYLSTLQMLGHYSFLSTLMTVIHSWISHELHKRGSWYWAYIRKWHAKTKMKYIYSWTTIM